MINTCERMTGLEEPILSRLNRLDNILKQLEDIRSAGHSPKSSYASTTSSGTLTSDGHPFSLVDFSPESLEKHCRPVDEVIMEVERKGTLIERLVHAEDRILKVKTQRWDYDLGEISILHDLFSGIMRFYFLEKNCVLEVFT
ncbi:UNVERIFIED_CONTAM: hypothetical protein Sradi_5807100 [Sesamum radiatum]|uniref:Uncharacterized protein n=1 Tax=Sesamum radiatum TaxID=300843 RepID=A0AAW2KSR0_SESRA